MSENVAGLTLASFLFCTSGSILDFMVLANIKPTILRWWVSALLPLGLLYWFILYIGADAKAPSLWKAVFLGLFQGPAIAFTAWIFDRSSTKLKWRSRVQASLALLDYFPISCALCAFIYIWWIDPPLSVLKPLPVYADSHLVGGCSSFGKEGFFWNVYETGASVQEVARWYKANSRQGRLSLNESSRGESAIEVAVLLDGDPYQSLTIQKSNLKKHRVIIFVPAEESSRVNYDFPCERY